MNTLREPYTTFMASTRHHDMSDPRFHFVPTLETDSTEIDRLHELPHGTKIREYQRRGAAVFHEMTKLVLLEGDLTSMRYFEDVVAPAPYNSQAYGSHGTTEAMNRQVPLPFMADPRDDWEMSVATAKSRTMESANLSEMATSNLLYGHMINHIPQYKIREAGRDIGNSALWLANVSLPESYPSKDPYDIQYAVRARSLDMVERSRTIGRAIGMHPSLAALADIDSAYSAYLRRNAPTRTVRDAIVQAQEEILP